VLLVFGLTDKMLLWSYVCTEKNLKLQEAAKKKALLIMDRSLGETGKFEPQRHGCKQHYSSKWTEDEIQNHTQQEGLWLVFVFSNL